MRNPFAVAATLAPLAAHAVVGTTSNSAPELADGAWSFVGTMGGASAVAIDRYHVLTAAHVSATDFLLGGVAYAMESTVTAPNVGGSAVDLRMVTLDMALPGWYDLGNSVKKGTAVTMVGYGGAGVVNAAGSGYSVLATSGRHAGLNAISSLETTGGKGPTMRALLRHAGDAALTGGDSGGGWFVGGQLVGISDFTFSTNANRPDYGFSSNPYFGSGAIDVTNPTLRAWIVGQMAIGPVNPQAVPEPSALLALALGAGALLRRKRR